MSIQYRRSRDLPQQAAAADVPQAGAGRLPPGEGEPRAAQLDTPAGGDDAGYRYEQLGDALTHARQSRSGPDEGNDGHPRPASVPPTNSEQTLMASLGIQYDGRSFRFAGFRYDRLADAVLYARRAEGPT